MHNVHLKRADASQGCSLAEFPEAYFRKNGVPHHIPTIVGSMNIHSPFSQLGYKYTYAHYPVSYIHSHILLSSALVNLNNTSIRKVRQ